MIKADKALNKLSFLFHLKFKKKLVTVTIFDSHLHYYVKFAMFSIFV